AVKNPGCRSVVGHLVDADGDGEDEPFLLSWCDLDAVRVSDPEPTFRHFGDLVAAALDLVLMVDDVPFCLHVIAALDLDREAFAQRGDQRLLDRCNGVAVALELHLVAHAQLLLLDREQLLARPRLQHQRVTDPERLPVDLERTLAAVSLDPVIATDREHLLAHLVLRPAVIVTAAAKQWHLEPPAQVKADPTKRSLSAGRPRLQQLLQPD